MDLIAIDSALWKLLGVKGWQEKHMSVFDRILDWLHQPAWNPKKKWPWSK